MIIAIEGMDGVGKSTIAHKLEERYGFKYISKPLKYFLGDNIDALEIIEREIYKINDPVIKSWFFGLGNIFTIRNYKDEDLIIDRHFVSNYFWNGEEQSDLVFKTMIELVGKPDITVILYANPSTRMERLIQRNPKDRDITDPEKWVNGYDKMIRFANYFDLPYVLIDTEGKTVEVICDEIGKIIESIKNDKYALFYDNKS